jgi:hypothetical protein
MNRITRVIGSVVVLGACAAAMRLTMEKVELGATKVKSFTARLDVSKAKSIKMHIEATALEQFFINPSVSGRIASSFLATADRALYLRDNTKLRQSPEKNTAYVSFGTHTNEFNSFFVGKPATRGIAEMRLPHKIPLSLDVYAIPHLALAHLNLDGLEVKNLQLNPLDYEIKQLRVTMPKGSLKATFSVNNKSGHTVLDLMQPIQGRLNIKQEEGLVEFRRYYETHSANIRIAVYGLNNDSLIASRVQKANPNIVWKELNDGRALYGVSQKALPNPFVIEIHLGKNAKVIF